MFGAKVRRGLVRIVTVVTLTGAVTSVVGAPAQAISPGQTTTRGVVSLLGNDNAGSIQRFWSRNFAAWGYRYTTPPVWYYGNEYGNYMTGCGTTADYLNNGFYCSRDHDIYLDYWYMQKLINRYGDFAAGGFLAHEWGHAVGAMLGYRMSGYQSEYFADCLAGMYTRWGYATGRLTGTDFTEFSNWLLSTPRSTTHGDPTLRQAWFKYGYQTYDINKCALAYNA